MVDHLGLSQTKRPFFHGYLARPSSEHGACPFGRSGRHETAGSSKDLHMLPLSGSKAPELWNDGRYLDSKTRKHFLPAVLNVLSPWCLKLCHISPGTSRIDPKSVAQTLGCMSEPPAIRVGGAVGELGTGSKSPLRGKSGGNRYSNGGRGANIEPLIQVPTASQDPRQPQDSLLTSVDSSFTRGRQATARSQIHCHN